MDEVSMTKLYIKKNQFGIFYYKDSEMTILHRLDDPAMEYANGTKVWYQNGKCHRLDGPAVERVNGDKLWYQNDQLHRLDGPAVEHADGIKQYYYQGEEFPSIKTNEQWKRHLKWMKFQ